MTDHQKRVKQYYLADKKARRIRNCKYCSWCEGYSFKKHCELKDKGFSEFFRIRAYLCKFYTPE